MLLMIDLTARQAGRVLEQARRMRVPLEVDVRSAPGEEPICTLVTDVGPRIVQTQLSPACETLSLAALIGSFCDARITLDGQLYLFTTCIVDVDDQPQPANLTLARPQTIQLANRRRFERAIVQPVEPLSVWLESQPAPRVGLLGDISGDGVLCHIPGNEWSDLALVGDGARIVFELPGHDEPFDLPCTICNKAFSNEMNQLSLGLEFASPADDSQTRNAIERLRAVLASLMITNLRTDEDA